MQYQLEENIDGDYEKDGKRYIVSECNAAYTPDGLNVGYTYFETREEMMATWGLAEVKDQVLDGSNHGSIYQ